MQKKYESPVLTVVGEANNVVMGSGFPGVDNGQLTAPDFEFEQD